MSGKHGSAYVIPFSTKLERVCAQIEIEFSDPFQLIALEGIITELYELLLFVPEHRNPKVAAFAFKGESFLNFRSNDPQVIIPTIHDRGHGEPNS